MVVLMEICWRSDVELCVYGMDVYIMLGFDGVI